MVGAPGAGKNILTKRLTTISPPLTLEEVLEIAKVCLAAVKINEHTALMTKRPFRSLHLTISDVALVGVDTFPQPGEISIGSDGDLIR